jgi:hypothetical protein
VRLWRQPPKKYFPKIRRFRKTRPKLSPSAYRYRGITLFLIPSEGFIHDKPTHNLFHKPRRQGDRRKFAESCTKRDIWGHQPAARSSASALWFGHQYTSCTPRQTRRVVRKIARSLIMLRRIPCLVMAVLDYRRVVKVRPPAKVIGVFLRIVIYEFILFMICSVYSGFADSGFKF